MPRAGRNDPCPCGSGKKYKNCCMRREQLGESQRLGTNPYEAVLFNALYEYALSERFIEHLNGAFEIYWGGAYDMDGLQELDSDSVFRWMEWFVHDYRIGPEKRRPVELYREGPGSELPDELQALLAVWVDDATLGLYRVEGVEDGHLTLKDLLRDESLTVEDRVMARSARRGDLLVARVYEWQGARHLTSASMLLPPDMEPALADYVRNAYANYCSQHVGTTWEAFLRANGHIFMAFLLSARGEVLRLRVGRGTRYADPIAARQKLHEFTRRRRQEREEQLLREIEGRPRERRTASGLILPGEEEQAEDASAERKRPSILIPGRDE